MESISNLKVPDLKRECKTRGLSTAGSKSDLVQRLTAAMAAEKQVDDSLIDDSDALIDESILEDDDEENGDEVLDETPVVVSPSKVGTKRPLGDSADGEEDNKKKITIKRQTVSVTDDSEDTKVDEKISVTSVSPKKLPIRQITSNLDEQLEKRKEKFGIVQAEDALKKRQERFGINAPAEGKVKLASEEESKLNKRKLRFGIVSEDTKLSQRAMKFGVPEPITGSPKKASNPFLLVNDEKKKLRAARFGN